MIIGTGIDIVEIKRMKEVEAKWGKGFFNRVFTERELEYSNERKFRHQHLAARFAAKEALTKAFGDKSAQLVNWCDVEILNEQNGKPYFNLSGRAKSLQRKRGADKIFLSLSHSKTYAVAVVILQKGKA